MNKQYKPADHETRIYALWEKANAFTPKIDKKKKPFCIILPPPNANADLHLGHGMYVIEDVLVRYHRMKGDCTLWLPGADHAGIETQFVFEKQLKKQGKSRFDFSQEQLYQNIWNFVQKNKSRMQEQLERLGFSLDWTRDKFTLEPEIVSLVYRTFKKLYDDGLVYRGDHIVNYCTQCGTAFSNLEINYVEKKDPLYYIHYGPFVLATTRLETKFGDTAVAFHPGDKRYEKYLAKEVTVEGVNGPFKVKVIADAAIDPKFGTGIEKVTPAHDMLDFEIAQRHNLPLKKVIEPDGRLNKLAGRFAGLKVMPARKAIFAAMKEKGLIDHVDENYLHNVATCYKCGTVIEPLIMPQWFVKVKPLTQKAIEVVKKSQIKIIPKRFEKIYYQWLENLHDWNISRQIVWGIRIPAWKCLDCAKNNQPFDCAQGKQSGISNQSPWIITDGPKPHKCPTCGSTNLEQDPDTFDTWFSSAQWPFATLQTTKPGDFDYFYPTSVMDTMWDILPFWVIRMVMLGIYMTGKIPFKVVYLHSRVTDVKGQKMSKSKGNVINPMDMIEKYGADALRLSLVFGTSPGRDLKMSEDKIRGFRNFTNKLWNIGRFINLSTSEESPSTSLRVTSEVLRSDSSEVERLTGLQPDDLKLLKSLKSLIKSTTNHLDNYRFSQAAEELYQFVWHTLADKYLESIKGRLKNKDKAAFVVLHHTFLTCLKLLHPFVPYITEVLWQQLNQKKALLISSSWPTLNKD